MANFRFEVEKTHVKKDKGKQKDKERNEAQTCLIRLCKNESFMFAAERVVNDNDIIFSKSVAKGFVERMGMPQEELDEDEKPLCLTLDYSHYADMEETEESKQALISTGILYPGVY